MSNFFSSSLLIHGLALLAFLLTAASVVLYLLQQRSFRRSRAASRRSSICSERYPLLLEVGEDEASNLEEGQSHVLHLYRHEDMSLAPRGLLSDLDYTQDDKDYLVTSITSSSSSSSFTNHNTNSSSSTGSSNWYGRWWKRKPKQRN